MIENFITELENLKTFSFKRYDTEGKVCVDKVGVDIKDLQNTINQFKESLIDYKVIATRYISEYKE